MQTTEQNLADSLKRADFQQRLIEEIFQALNDKEQDVIKKRFSLKTSKKYTLDQIGKEYGITRERVRQIEKTALGKLTRIASKTSLLDLIEICNKAMTEHNYFATENEIINTIVSKTSGLFIDNKNLITLCLAVNPEFAVIKKSKNYEKSWYKSSKLTVKKISTILTISEKILKKENIILPENKFLDQILTELKTKKITVTKSTIKSVVTCNKNLKMVKEGYGLSYWRNINPKSIRDKVLIALARQNKPLHFRKIAKLIHETDLNTKQVTIQAVHNELIRYDDFVLVGRGIYALKEWGFSEGTVKDVISEILKASGPLKKSKIVEEVLKRRHVKIGTISLNLQKYPEFKRIGRAVYTI